MSAEEADAAILIGHIIKPHLAGHTPGVQGAVLAELVATWLAGHHPAVRNSALTLWSETMLRLVPVCVDQIRRRNPNA